jgi:hypothetical protein
MKRIIFVIILVVQTTLCALAQTPAPARYNKFLFGVDYYPEQWDEGL